MLLVWNGTSKFIFVL